MNMGQNEERTEGVYALARDIAERLTGMPAYLVDDETWEASVAEAEATYVEPPPKSALQEAIDRARYPDPVEFINAHNEARRRGARPGSSGHKGGCVMPQINKVGGGFTFGGWFVQLPGDVFPGSLGPFPLRVVARFVAWRQSR